MNPQRPIRSDRPTATNSQRPTHSERFTTTHSQQPFQSDRSTAFGPQRLTQNDRPKALTRSSQPAATKPWQSAHNNRGREIHSNRPAAHHNRPRRLKNNCKPTATRTTFNSKKERPACNNQPRATEMKPTHCWYRW